MHSLLTYRHVDKGRNPELYTQRCLQESLEKCSDMKAKQKAYKVRVIVLHALVVYYILWCIQQVLVGWHQLYTPLMNMQGTHHAYNASWYDYFTLDQCLYILEVHWLHSLLGFNGVLLWGEYPQLAAWCHPICHFVVLSLHSHPNSGRDFVLVQLALPEVRCVFVEHYISCTSQRPAFCACCALIRS